MDGEIVLLPVAEQPVEEQNIPADQFVHYDPIPWIGVVDDNVANLNESVEETQAKVDALKPEERVEIPFRHFINGNVRLADWHFVVGSYVIHAGFDIKRRFIVLRDGQNLSRTRETLDTMIIGNGHYAVYSNGKLVYYDSLKAAAKIYTSSELTVLRQEEKNRKYRQRTDAIIAEMRSQLAQLWYSPGMPGAKEAGEHFASIKPESEPFY